MILKGGNGVKERIGPGRRCVFRGGQWWGKRWARGIILPGENVVSMGTLPSVRDHLILCFEGGQGT